MSASSELIEKYNVPGPRYTSYPTVPYWDEEKFSVGEWKQSLKQTFLSTKKSEEGEEGGISLYIHLPFCESLCTYCGCNTRITVKHEVEGPYIDRLLKEWDLYLEILRSKPTIKEIHLGGGTPTFFAADNLNRLITGILGKAMVHPNPVFSFEAHPANTNHDHLSCLYELGFTRISLGIQDFNEKVQATINRFQTYEQVKQVTEDAREIGYTSINYDLIFGLPYQTLKGVEKTIEQVKSLRPERIAFYSYAHVPWIKPGQRSYVDKDLPSHGEKRALYEKGREMFAQAGYLEIGMDHFALPGDELYKAVQAGTVHRNFMGYTPAATKILIGLGVSSIGDSWNAFAQNVKVVEEYNKLIDENKLPVFRGHLLTQEDLLIRKLILDVMCKMETTWDSSYNDYQELENTLSEMVSDHLVGISSDGLKVTEAGRPFVRNVCMALDKKLRQKEPDTQIFSSVI